MFKNLGSFNIFCVLTGFHFRFFNLPFEHTATLPISLAKCTFIFSYITRGRVRVGPSFQLGTLQTPIDWRLVFPTRWFSAAAAAENKHVGKTRHRSIYTHYTERHATDMTYHQWTSQPAWQYPAESWEMNHWMNIWMNGYGMIFNFTDVLRLHFIEITSHGQAFRGHYGNDTSCAEEGVSRTSQ